MSSSFYAFGAVVDHVSHGGALNDVGKIFTMAAKENDVQHDDARDDDVVVPAVVDEIITIDGDGNHGREEAPCEKKKNVTTIKYRPPKKILADTPKDVGKPPLSPQKTITNPLKRGFWKHRSSISKTETETYGLGVLDDPTATMQAHLYLLDDHSSQCSTVKDSVTTVSTLPTALNNVTVPNRPPLRVDSSVMSSLGQGSAWGADADSDWSTRDSHDDSSASDNDTATYVTGYYTYDETMADLESHGQGFSLGKFACGKQLWSSTTANSESWSDKEASINENNLSMEEQEPSVIHDDTNIPAMKEATSEVYKYPLVKDVDEDTTVANKQPPQQEGPTLVNADEANRSVLRLPQRQPSEDAAAQEQGFEIVAQTGNSVKAKKHSEPNQSMNTPTLKNVLRWPDTDQSASVCNKGKGFQPVDKGRHGASSNTDTQFDDTDKAAVLFRNTNNCNGASSSKQVRANERIQARHKSVGETARDDLSVQSLVRAPMYKHISTKPNTPHSMWATNNDNSSSNRETRSNFTQNNLMAEIKQSLCMSEANHDHAQEFNSEGDVDAHTDTPLQNNVQMLAFYGSGLACGCYDDTITESSTNGVTKKVTDGNNIDHDHSGISPSTIVCGFNNKTTTNEGNRPMVFPNLRVAGFAEEEIAPIRKKMLWTQFVSDVFCLNLDSPKPRFEKEPDIIIPGAQIEMVLNDAAAAVHGKKQKKHKDTMNNKAKARKGAKEQWQPKRASLKRTQEPLSMEGQRSIMSGSRCAAAFQHRLLRQGRKGPNTTKETKLSKIQHSKQTKTTKDTKLSTTQHRPPRQGLWEKQSPKAKCRHSKARLPYIQSDDSMLPNVGSME
jgi:hypothetical protein